MRTTVLLVLLGLVGCIADPPLPGAPEGRLTVILDSAVRALDPRFTVDETSMKVSRMLFSGLVTVDNARVEPKLDLATAVTRLPACPPETPGDRPICYRVHLRRGVRFHDGTPLTARDIIFTYRSLLDPELGSPYRGAYARKFIDVRPVKDNPLAADFVLFQEYATFLTDLVMGIVPAHVLTETGGRFPRERYVGTGPFRFHSRLMGRRIVLERNRRFHDGAPSFRYLVFRTIEDESTRLLALAGGTGDIMINAVSPILLEVVQRQEGVVVESIPSLIWSYMALNLRDPILSSPAVRRALLLAIDRDEVIRRKLHGYASPSNSMLSPISWAHVSDLALPAPDPARAEALLDEAGFPRDPVTGRRFVLRIKISTDRFRRSVARTIAHQLAAVGIDTEIRSFELGTFLSDIRSGNFQATILNLPDPSEPDMLRWMFYSMSTPSAAPASPPGGEATTHGHAFEDRRLIPPGLHTLLAGEDEHCRAWAHAQVATGIERLIQYAWGHPPARDTSNRTYYANPRFDCLVLRAADEPRRSRRRPLYEEAQRILADDLPVLPLWHEHRVVVRRERVRGFEILPNGRLTPLARVTLVDDEEERP